MDAVLENAVNNVNTTAMILGYPVLLIIVILLGWFGTRIFRDVAKILNEMRYDRRKRNIAGRDWDNIEASFVLELDEDLREPYIPVQRDFNDKHDTLVLPPDFGEQLFNYQEERRERS